MGLEKNRISARECRKRKKEANQVMEEEIERLESENLTLRLQLHVGIEADESTRQEQERLTQLITELLMSGGSEAQVHYFLEEFKERFADYGRDRRSATEYHLSNIERLLMPTTTTTLAMGVLRSSSSTKSTANSTSSTNSDPAVGAEPQTKKLFHYLVDYLKINPKQAAKFLVWVSNNEACMYMLNELWDKINPVPILAPVVDKSQKKQDDGGEGRNNSSNGNNKGRGKGKNSTDTNINTNNNTATKASNTKMKK